MNKKQFISLGFNEEQATKAIDAFSEELRGYIPKIRFDEVNNKKKMLEGEVRKLAKLLEELAEKHNDSELLKGHLEKLQEANKLTAAKFEADLKEFKLNMALKYELTGKTHDPDIVIGLLDKSKIELDHNDNISVGLEEQLKSLMESKAFLFVSKSKLRVKEKKSSDSKKLSGAVSTSYSKKSYVMR